MADNASLYRRYVHLWNALSGLTAFLAVFFIFTRITKFDENAEGCFIFGECFMDAILFIIAFALNFGMATWVTFVAGIVMFINLPSMIFEHIQSKLLPLYFLIGALCGFLMLAIAVSSRTAASPGWEKETVMLALIAIFLPNMINGTVVGPRSTAIMFERDRMVREAGDEDLLKDDPDYKAIKKQFGLMLWIGSLLNLVALGGSFYVLYWMSRMIHEVSKPIVI